MPTLPAEVLGHLILYHAALGDSEHGRRLQELINADTQAKRDLAAADARYEEARRLFEQADSQRQFNVTVQIELKARNQALDDRQRALMGGELALTNEKRAWELIRNQVDAQQLSATAQNEAKTRQLATYAEALDAREADLTTREAAVGEAIARELSK